MKTVFINCSPKERFCASAYFLFLQRLFTGGTKVYEKLRNPADQAGILEQLRDAQAVVFGLPLYVDGVPSHVLRFMEEMEVFCRENGLQVPVINTGNPEEYTIRQLAEQVLEFLPDTGSKLVFEPLPKDDPKRRKPDIPLAKELLGWKPVVPLREGLEKTIAYFRGM